MRRLDPAYRACFADGSTIHVRHGREAMRDEIDADLRQRRRGRVRRRSSTGCASSTWSRCRTSSTATTTPRSGCSPRRGRSPELLRLGAFGRLGAAVRRRFRDPRLHRLFSFQAMYAGLAPDAALALYAVITYMDSIEGVYFPEGGMHAVPVGAWPRPRRRPARPSATATRSSAILRSPTGRVAGVRTAAGAQILADAVVCTVDLPVAYADASWPTSGRRGRPGAVATPPRRWSGTSAYAGCRSRRSPTTTSTSASEWGAAFDALLKRGPADARPVAAGHRAVAGRAHRGARTAARRCTCWSRCPT